MILTCPSCNTRYQADAAKFPSAGRDVRCAKCGETWHQRPPEPEFDPGALVEEPAPEPVSQPMPSPPQEEPRPQAYVQSAPSFAVEPPEPVARRPSPWPRRILLTTGWAGLAAIVLVIGFAATNYRQQIVAAWPQTASLYAGVGAEVNASGFRFENVKYHQRAENGEPVLAVSGTLLNVTTHDLPVPQIRVSLSDGEMRELYHWTFAPDVTTLGPGKATNFTTRLTSPPSAARHLDLRIAKAGE